VIQQRQFKRTSFSIYFLRKLVRWTGNHPWVT
jgi:hypothetical protein